MQTLHSFPLRKMNKYINFRSIQVQTYLGSFLILEGYFFLADGVQQRKFFCWRTCFIRCFWRHSCYFWLWWNMSSWVHLNLFWWVQVPCSGVYNFLGCSLLVLLMEMPQSGLDWWRLVVYLHSLDVIVVLMTFWILPSFNSTEKVTVPTFPVMLPGIHCLPLPNVLNRTWSPIWNAHTLAIVSWLHFCCLCFFSTCSATRLHWVQSYSWHPPQ